MMTSCEEEGMDEVSNITDETIEEIDRDPAVAAAGTALSQLNLEKTSHTTSNKASTEDVLLHRTPCVVNESSNTTDSQSGQDTSYYMARIRQLSQEVDQLTYQLQQERIGRDAMATASRRADESLAKVLADAWAAFDTEREAHQATKDDAEEFEREYEYYRDLYHRTEERLYREMVSMKEAMVTVQRVQRELTKVREDNEVILDRLVKAKLEYANKCMEYDDLEKNYVDMLRLYHRMLEGHYPTLTSRSTLSSDSEQTERQREEKEIA